MLPVRSSCLIWVGIKILGPSSGFSETRMAEVWAWRAWSLASLFTFAGTGMEWGNSYFCGVWLEQSGYYLNIFCLSWCSFSGPLDRERRLLLELLLFTIVRVNKLPASSAPSLGYMRQTENPRNLSLCHSSDPDVPSQTASFSLTFKVFLYVFYM